MCVNVAPVTTDPAATYAGKSTARYRLGLKLVAQGDDEV